MTESDLSRSYFTGLARGYDRYRPAYPPPAIDALLQGLAPPVRAASIGCGTGICCRLLAARGVRIIGIDPNLDMLAEAQRRSETSQVRIDYRQGIAENTGLPAECLDLLLCAQSFHWFRTEAALPEFQRVLHSDGRLALMWNVRDTEDAFARCYSAIARRAQEHAQTEGRVVRRNRSGDPASTGHFTDVRTLSFPNPQALSEDELLGRARSASYFPKEGPLAAELEAELRRAFAAHARDGAVILKQNTEVTIARPCR